MAYPPTKERGSSYGWIIPSLIIGLALFIPKLILGDQLPTRVWEEMVMTGAILYALVSSFKRRWSELRFWLLLAAYMALHSLVLHQLRILSPDLDFRTVIVVGFTEAIVGWFAIAVALGGKRFFDEE